MVRVRRTVGMADPGNGGPESYELVHMENFRCTVCARTNEISYRKQIAR